MKLNTGLMGALCSELHRGYLNLSGAKGCTFPPQQCCKETSEKLQTQQKKERLGRENKNMHCNQKFPKVLRVIRRALRTVSIVCY